MNPSKRRNTNKKERKRINYFLSLITLLLIFILSKKSFAINDSVLVDFGSKKITLEEFVKRFELTPWPRREIKSFSEDQKTEFLYSLIAEKLLSIEAENNSLDTAYNLRTANKLIEKMFIRDALYKKEIKNKVKISKDEENDAFAKAQIKLFVKYIYSQDSAHIYEIYSSLIKGASFDSILSERPELEKQSEPIEVSYGSMPVKIEETLYRTAVKNFTLPISADYGYYIFRVDSSTIQVIFGDKKSNDVYKKSQKILRERKEEELFQKYFKSFFAKKRAEASGEMFLILANELYKISLSKLQANNTSNKVGKLVLEPKDVDRLEFVLGNKINEPFIFIDKDKFSVKEFLDALLFHGFIVQDTSIEYLERRLNSRIKSFIEDEFLAIEGKRQNLDKLPEVQSDLSMWKDFYRNISFNSEFKKEIQVEDKEVES
ncbi:MAG: hypothetical protein N3A61_01995, partial [Ignavibacteria bacterium]|nr:hypothetical protein [Ignavibacteria bacterium]